MEQDSQPGQSPRPKTDGELIGDGTVLEELTQHPGWSVFMDLVAVRQGQAWRSLRVPDPNYPVEHGRGALDILDGLLSDIGEFIGQGKALRQQEETQGGESPRVPPTIRRGGGSLASG